MFSSKKILYYIILSMLLVCFIAGIDFRSSIYSNDDETIVDFSDSSFYAPSPHGQSEGEVGILENGENAVSVFEYDGFETTTTEAETTTETTTTTVAEPDDEPTRPDESVAPTTTTRTRVATTTTTARTAAPTTTTAAAPPADDRSDSGSMHFEHQAIWMYAGNSANVALQFPLAAQQLATVSSLDSSVATAYCSDGKTVVISGVSVGETYIKAVNSYNEVAYCRVIVTDYAGRVIQLVNEERSSAGLRELSLGSSLLQSVADLRLSETLVRFDHVRPNDEKFSTAAQELGLRYSYLGENLARGQTTPEQVVAEWMDSPSHRKNIMSEDYTHLCVSYGTDSSGFPYWVQIFWRSR